MKFLPNFVLIYCLTTLTSFAETWEIHTPYTNDVHTTDVLDYFASLLEMSPSIDANVELKTGAELFGNSDMFRAVRTGRALFGEILLGNLADIDPIFDLDNLPFLATDFTSARILWTVTRPAIERSLSDQGIVLLYAVPWPPQGLYTNQRINTVSDLSGLRLRSYSLSTTDLAHKLNTLPVPLSTQEIPRAFAENTIDAMITSSTMGVATQAWRFAQHYTAIPSWLPKNIVMMNKRWFDGLPTATQSAILAAAEDAEKQGWARAEDSTQEMVAHLAGQGMEIAQPTPELQHELRQIGLKMAVEWAATAGLTRQLVLEDYYRALEDATPSRNDTNNARPVAQSPFLIRNAHYAIDPRTGLIWQRCSFGQTANGEACEGTAQRHSWSGAQRIIDELNQQEGTQWRLPTRTELAEIQYCHAGRRAPNSITLCEEFTDRPTLYRDTFPDTLPRWYWTQDTLIDDDGYAWALDFSVGHQYPIGKFGYSHYLRLVREP